MDPRTATSSGDAPAIDAEGDALDHLWNAAHEMLRAMRMLIDAADEFVESQRGARLGPRAAHEPRAAACTTSTSTDARGRVRSTSTSRPS